MSLDDLLDIHSTAIKRRGEHSRYDFNDHVDEDSPRHPLQEQSVHGGLHQSPCRAGEGGRGDPQEAEDRQKVPRFGGKGRAPMLDPGRGRKKIFEVCRVHSDITFIDTFLTPEFCMEHKLFSPSVASIIYMMDVSGSTTDEQKDFNPQRVKGKHIAPHAIEVGAFQPPKVHHRRQSDRQ